MTLRCVAPAGNHAGQSKGADIVKKLLVAVILGLASLSAAAQQSPDEFVREAAELLDEAVTERRAELASDREALYELINEILLPRFDRRYAAQLVLGRHWRTASEEQREQQKRQRSKQWSNQWSKQWVFLIPRS